ncbi:hypothetical protein D3C72_2116650 [compost metagenome]
MVGAAVRVAGVEQNELGFAIPVVPGVGCSKQIIGPAALQGGFDHSVPLLQSKILPADFPLRHTGAANTDNGRVIPPLQQPG